MSAVLIIPVMLALAAARLCDGRPLPIVRGRWRREIDSRTGQALAPAAAIVVHGGMIVAVIGRATASGFRLLTPGDGNRFVAPWEYMLNEPAPIRRASCAISA